MMLLLKEIYLYFALNKCNFARKYALNECKMRMFMTEWHRIMSIWQGSATQREWKGGRKVCGTEIGEYMTNADCKGDLKRGGEHDALN